MTIAAVRLSVRERRGVHAPKSHQEELQQVGKIRIRHGPSVDPNRKFNMVAGCKMGTAHKTALSSSCAPLVPALKSTPARHVKRQIWGDGEMHKFTNLPSS